MNKIPLCLIGCGGMGHRHLFGYKELEDSGISNVDVVAVCDNQKDNADFAAKEVERLFGKKPMVFYDVDEVLNNSEIVAVDVVSQPASHHSLAIPALKAGKHAMVEKPLALTIKACKEIIKASQDTSMVLATTENLRRDPTNRLVKAIVEEGLIGDPYYMVSNELGGDDLFRITPWRHLKNMGAIGLDYGVHMADIFQYYLGRFEQVYGCGMIVEPTRKKPEVEVWELESYKTRFQTYPDFIDATGEDSVIGMYKTVTGAMVSMAYISAGRGGREFQRSLHGRWGSIYAPGDRNGNPVVLKLENSVVKGNDIAKLLDKFPADEITEVFFGKGNLTYDLPSQDIDSKLMAIEFYDFASAIISGGTPEVTGEVGMHAVAAILGAYESSLQGRMVTFDEIISEEVTLYQDEINKALGFD